MPTATSICQELTGTVALVTGSSSGIGRATALAIASRGAAVGLVARRKDRLNDLARKIEAEGGNALAVPADITDRAQATAAVMTVVDRFGRLDTLVNNGVDAAGPHRRCRSGAVGADDRDQPEGPALHDKRGVAAFACGGRAGASKVADIVNISSIAGRVAWANYGVYNMTKFAQRVHRSASPRDHQAARTSGCP